MDNHHIDFKTLKISQRLLGQWTRRSNPLIWLNFRFDLLQHQNSIINHTLTDSQKQTHRNGCRCGYKHSTYNFSRIQCIATFANRTFISYSISVATQRRRRVKILRTSTPNWCPTNLVSQLKPTNKFCHITIHICDYCNF